jgi:hypothetical protein
MMPVALASRMPVGVASIIRPVWTKAVFISARVKRELRIEQDLEELTLGA